MSNLTRDFFIGLSNNKFFNTNAKKWGFQLGAEKFVAGTTIESVMNTVRELNQQGICCTLDNLGEFVSDKMEASMAKDDIIRILDEIHTEKLDCHISVKLTQLGLDIDPEFCLDNIRQILDIAAKYDIFINIDMENYAYYNRTLEAVEILNKEYSNVGTVIQSYLYRVEADLDLLKDVRIRLVKGAYKESGDVAYQSKEQIDSNYIKLAKKRLLGNTFTSIATHDHNIINELKDFIEENQISGDNFEFQMLYGFRTEMQYKLAEEGYRFCTYIPFGNDWFGYFMRRLAERPQNLNLVAKDAFYTKDNKLKKGQIIAGAAIALTFFIWRKKRRK